MTLKELDEIATLKTKYDSNEKNKENAIDLLQAGFKRYNLDENLLNILKVCATEYYNNLGEALKNEIESLKIKKDSGSKESKKSGPEKPKEVGPEKK